MPRGPLETARRWARLRGARAGRWLGRLLPRGRRGMALVMVLGTIAMLTVSVVEFVYSTRVNLHLAQNQRDEVKAYFLAKSGINLQRLALSYQFELGERGDLLGRAASNGRFQLWRYLDIFLPIITKGAFETPIGSLDFTSMGGEGFGGLKGEIELEDVVPEDGKTSLNSLIQSPLPDATVKSLCGLFLPFALTQPQNRDAREDAKQRYELVAAIIDHIDLDCDLTIVDESCTVQKGGAGNEISRYVDLDWEPKNEPLVTLDELLMVPGMTPELLERVRDHLTVYDVGAFFFANQAHDLDWFSFLCSHIEGAPPGLNPCASNLDIARTVLFHALVMDGRVRFFENPLQVVAMMAMGGGEGSVAAPEDLAKMIAFPRTRDVVSNLQTVGQSPQAGAFWAMYSRLPPEFAPVLATLGYTPQYFAALLQNQVPPPQLLPVQYDTEAMTRLVRTDTPKIYTISATGRYGAASRDIRAVVDFNRDGRYLYWSER